MPLRRLGTVFLRRLPGSNDVVVFPGITLFGSTLAFDEKLALFTEPCWGQRYRPDGRCIQEFAPYRQLHTLDVEIRQGIVYDSCD